MDSKSPSLDALRIDRREVSARRRSGWWALWLLLLLGVIGVGGWALVRGRGATVKTATVQVLSAPGPTGRTLLNASGYVTTRLEATVSSKVTGKVTEVLVEEGMKVDKDQILARLDASNVHAGLRLAEARLASARMSMAETEPMVHYTHAEFKRLTGLEEARAVSRSDLAKAEAEAQCQQGKLDRQKADVIVAERQVDEWRQQLEDTVIRAPFSGVVTTKDSQPGEMISPMSSGGFTRTGICSLVDMASLEIEVDVSESFINRVVAGQLTEATLDAYPEWRIPSKVIAIIPTADRQKATVKVRVAIDALDARILPQMGVKVAFLSDEGAASRPEGGDALTVPKEAVQRVAGQDVAWVVRNGKAERRAVKVARPSGNVVVLSAGLVSGETVILNAPDRLADGAAVTTESSR